ncbi:MAG: DUF357 domain-containing protein [Thermoprotei archaeon]|nr:MAG: DUF357 domain-containing protein [Thermoprotei archaeon]
MERESEERIKKYIGYVEKVLAEIKGKYKGKVEKLIELAESYMKDAKYYLSKGNPITSTSCIAYAEGLLDALRLLGFVDFEWRSREPTVIVGGVFDLLHPGHIYFLKEARKLGRLVVVVASDETVRISKGREPIFNQDQRAEIVGSLVYVDKVIKGGRTIDIKSVIERVKPEVIVIGPDQDKLESIIKDIIKSMGIDVKIYRIREKVPMCSSSIIARKLMSGPL